MFVLSVYHFCTMFLCVCVCVCVCVCFITCRAYKNQALGDLSIFSHGSKFESAASFFFFFFFAGDMID